MANPYKVTSKKRGNKGMLYFIFHERKGLIGSSASATESGAWRAIESELLNDPSVGRPDVAAKEFINASECLAIAVTRLGKKVK